jgi:hypothetical protein
VLGQTIRSLPVVIPCRLDQAEPLEPGDRTEEGPRPDPSIELADFIEQPDEVPGFAAECDQDP